MERSEITEADHLITGSTQIGSTNASKRKRHRKRSLPQKEAVECTQDPEDYEGVGVSTRKVVFSNLFPNVPIFLQLY